MPVRLSLAVPPSMGDAARLVAGRMMGHKLKFYGSPEVCASCVVFGNDVFIWLKCIRRGNICKFFSAVWRHVVVTYWILI